MLGPEAWTIPKKLQQIIPPKVTLFLWQASTNKIDVKANLLARGVAIENDGMCSICDVEIESTDHLLLSCASSWRLWYAILVREGVVWCCPKQIKEILLEWPSLRS